MAAVTAEAAVLIERAGPAQIETDDYLSLVRIYEPEVNLCVVQRSPPAATLAFCKDFLGQAEAMERRYAQSVATLANTRFFADADHVDGYAEWLADVREVATLFADLFGIATVGLRLAVLSTAMCPRFHVDNVLARMICTYGGPGTEWLPEAGIEGHALGGNSLAHGRHDVHHGAIRMLSPYALALMKGERWDGNQGRGLVHRSPALTADHPRRLVLTLDII